MLFDYIVKRLQLNAINDVETSLDSVMLLMHQAISLRTWLINTTNITVLSCDIRNFVHGARITASPQRRRLKLAGMSVRRVMLCAG